jgi:hypothetical protein
MERVFNIFQSSNKDRLAIYEYFDEDYDNFSEFNKENGNFQAYRKSFVEEFQVALYLITLIELISLKIVKLVDKKYKLIFLSFGLILVWIFEIFYNNFGFKQILDFSNQILQIEIFKQKTIF